MKLDVMKLDVEVLVKVRMAHKIQRGHRLKKRIREEKSSYYFNSYQSIKRRNYQRPSPTNKYPTNLNL